MTDQISNPGADSPESNAGLSPAENAPIADGSAEESFAPAASVEPTGASAPADATGAPAASNASAAASAPAPAAPAFVSDARAAYVPSTSAPTDEVDTSFEDALSGRDSSRAFTDLREGEVVQGVVVHIDRGEVLVDVGTKSEGIIRRNELSRDPSLNAEDIVTVGETISVYVMEAENQDGNLILSKKRADFEKAWEGVQQAKEENRTLQAMVTDRVKGGLVVDLGIRGFVPASHVGNGSMKNNLERYVGQSIALKVIEVDKERRKVVLSNKMAQDEERMARKEETVGSLEVGQIRKGTVRRLTNYGAFVDLGGIDGLLHISEMSWTRINHPQEVLKEGQELDVMVLKMDLEAGRVSLGLRQILPDPWTTIDEKYSLGDVINGQVSRVVPFGVFVQLDGGIEGIIPNAELGSRRGKGAPTLNPGDEVEVKVIDLRPDERKMSLSPRQITTTVDGVSTTHEFTDFEPAREPADRGVEPAPERGGEGGGRGGDRGGEGGGRGDRGGRGGEPRPERNRGPRDRGERGGGGGGRDRGDDSYDGGSFDRSYMDRNAEPRFTIGDALRAKEEQERESQEREGGDGDASGEGGGEE